MTVDKDGKYTVVTPGYDSSKVTAPPWVNQSPWLTPTTNPNITPYISTTPNQGYQQWIAKANEEKFESGAVRDSRVGKGRFDLLPPEGLQRLATVMENGCQKYGERNWEKGMPVQRFLDSAIRHVFQYLMGKTDEDHLGQAAWNLVAAITIEERSISGVLPESLQLESRRAETGA